MAVLEVHGTDCLNLTGLCRSGKKRKRKTFFNQDNIKLIADNSGFGDSNIFDSVMEIFSVIFLSLGIF